MTETTSDRASTALVPPRPPNAPFVRTGLSRVLGAAWLRASGWRLTGTFPDVPKAVIIVAPHSSNWDGLHGLAMKQVLGLDVRFVAKRQLFWWPLGPILRSLGAVAVDRSAATDLVTEAVAQFDSRERFWLCLTPEGTRKPVARWKTGFWRIARAANVPIVPAYFHYPEKRIGIGPALMPGDDMQADVERLRTFYAPWQGANGKRAV
jgi:1-acyl-sn-glycerol-3-phosphate acyltransferase